MGRMLRLGIVEGALESLNVKASGLSAADAVSAGNDGFWDWDCCSG